MQTAHAFNSGIVPIKIAVCELLKQELDTARKQLHECITKCRKRLEGTSPFSPEDVNKLCGRSNLNPDYFEPGSQCQKENDAHIEALSNYSACNTTKIIEAPAKKSGVIVAE